jgi:hypothetical protein
VLRLSASSIKKNFSASMIDLHRRSTTVPDHHFRLSSRTGKNGFFVRLFGFFAGGRRNQLTRL